MRYRVEFDTQRDRNYITWEVYVEAHNQKDAKEVAKSEWYKSDKYGDNKPHTFHLMASRETNATERETNKFYIIKTRYAYWGKR